VSSPSRRLGRSNFAALHTHNAALYFATQTLSMVGTFVQMFAQAWLVLTISGDTAALPLSIALQTLPLLVLGTWGGALADRLDNRRLLLATTAANAVLALTLGVLVSRGGVDVGVVYLFGILGGLVTVVERPATQAFLAEIVAPEQITSAVGINSMIFPFARLAGPPLAGLSIAAFGLAGCFIVNAMSFVVFFIGMLALRRADLYERRRTPQRKKMISAGLRYARRDRTVGHSLVVMFFVGLAGFNFMAAIPMMGKYTFHLTESGLVIPMAAGAVGSLLAGALGAGFAHPTLRTQAICVVAFGAILLMSGLAPTTTMWTVASVAVGFTAVLFTTITGQLLQQASAPEMLGRVMALNSIAFLGTTPFGMVMVAWLASTYTARAPFTVGGAAVLVTGLVSAATIARHRTPEPAGISAG
jgi:MFS family permease